jgi:hypothetical protein
MTVKELNKKFTEIYAGQPKNIIATKSNGKLYVIDLSQACRYNRVTPLDDETWTDAAIRTAENIEYR